jgi:hypothetical protein
MWREGGPRRKPFLLFPDHSPEIFLGQFQESFKLAHPVFADIPCAVRFPGLFKEPDGFLVVGLRKVQGVFERGFVLEGCFVIHAPSVVWFPG